MKLNQERGKISDVVTPIRNVIKDNILGVEIYTVRGNNNWVFMKYTESEDSDEQFIAFPKSKQGFKRMINLLFEAGKRLP